MEDDDAVSPVIGVILMVAITVILAAVIASFVLGLGGSQQQTPQASFSWDFDKLAENYSEDHVDGVAEVSHDGGDTIAASELKFRGEGFRGNNTDINKDSEDDADLIHNGEWPGGQTSGSQGDQSAVTGGDNVNLGVTSDYDISLVWEPQEGDTSATLSQETGPDA